MNNKLDDFIKEYEFISLENFTTYSKRLKEHGGIDISENDFIFIESIGVKYFKDYMILKHCLDHNVYENFINKEISREEIKELIKKSNINIKDIRVDFAHMTNIRVQILKVLLRFEQIYNNFIIKELLKNDIRILIPHIFSNNDLNIKQNDVDFYGKVLPFYNFDRLIVFLQQKRYFNNEDIDTVFKKKNLEKIKNLRNSCSHGDYIFDNKEYNGDKIFEFIAKSTSIEYSRNLLSSIKIEIEKININSRILNKKIIKELRNLQIK